MNSGVKLSDKDREALNRILEQLRDQGLRVSDQGVLIALLRAAIQLPEAELMKLIQQGLEAEGADRGSNSR